MVPDRPSSPAKPLSSADEERSTEQLLDRLLGLLDVEIEAFAICEVSRGWRLAFDAGDAPSVHYGLKGPGVAVMADGRRIGLAADTLLLLPPGLAHGFELAQGSTHECRISSQQLSQVGSSLVIRAGDEGVDLVIACGQVRASCPGLLDLVTYLGGPLVERFEHPSPLRGAFETVLAELAAPAVGTRTLTSALLKQCLVLLLQRRSARDTGLAPWLGALGDPRLARAILAMLERPTAIHAVGDLAAIAGMSRSAFAGRFTAVLGRPPMEFLRDVRLRHAAGLLETTDLPVKAVAGSVGYASRSHFSRAFKMLYGVDPASFRDRAASRPLPSINTGPAC